MRKITFLVVVADYFTNPEPDGGTHIHLWPVAKGESSEMDIDIEFEPSGGDVMREAEQALEKYMKENYPNKKYKIYYWDWKN